jgi:hypothetical protein
MASGSHDEPVLQPIRVAAGQTVPVLLRITALPGQPPPRGVLALQPEQRRGVRASIPVFVRVGTTQTTHQSWLSRWSPLISTAVAALAALLSLATVRQTRHARLDDRSPQVITQQSKTAEDAVRLDLHNVGGGALRNARWHVVSERSSASEGNDVDGGFMMPNAEPSVETGLPAASFAALSGAIYGIDAMGRVVAWNLYGRRFVLHRAWPRRTTKGHWAYEQTRFSGGRAVVERVNRGRRASLSSRIRGKR